MTTAVVIASAILDRPLHHATRINIKGRFSALFGTGRSSLRILTSASLC